MLQKKARVRFCFFIMPVFLICCSQGASPASPGKSGSLARFAVYGDYLYTVEKHSLAVFDISDKYKPNRIGSRNTDEVLETIFPYKSYLYLGTQTGMNIFSLKNPRDPLLLNVFGHILSCDPVVVRNDVAYFTLRSGTRCSRGINEVQAVDVADPMNPELLASHSLSKPFGLGIDGAKLFVLDEIEGLLVFDVNDPKRFLRIAQYKEISGYDCIALDGLLIVSAKEGLLFLDYNRMPVKELGRISIE